MKKETHVKTSPKRSGGTERQRNGETEKQSTRETEETKDTDELPPLAARVSALPEAVQLSLKDGLREDCLFVFARAVKAFEMTTNSRLPLAELDTAFAHWWRSAHSLLPPDADFDEWRFTFREAYSKARSPLGANHLEEAVRRADTNPHPPQADRYPSPRLKRLVAVCYQLQIMARGGLFFLSTRSAARIVRVKNPCIALALLNGLIADGVIALAQRGVPGGRRANRYRFNAPNLGAPLPSTEESRLHSRTLPTDE